MPYKERLERPRASLLEFLLLLAAHFEFIGVIVHAARVGIHLLGAPLMEVFQSATEAGEASLLGTVTTKSLANDHKNAGQLTKVELKKEGILAGVGYKRPLFTNKVQRIQDKVPNKFKRKKKTQLCGVTSMELLNQEPYACTGCYVLNFQRITGGQFCCSISNR